ncbi:MAG: SUMF1/EgtB/PvdO family nonheme iron enzyme [Kofleriaceae bacterium]|nr:SUMF1/EgtB/PvdO family nonheme iron enzyme [Kofleriaceae bacterium]
MLWGRLSLVVLVAACGYQRPADVPNVPNDIGSDTSSDAVAVSDGALDDAPSAMRCSMLASTCGRDGTSPCCESLLVPGGTYARSYDVATDGLHSDNSYTATVSSFRLDKYEVTVGRFREFVEAGQGTQASPPAANAGARTLNGTANQGGWDTAWNGNLTVNTAALMAALNCGTTFKTWTDLPGDNESRPITCVNWFEAMAFCIWDGGFLPTEAEWNYAASGGDEQRAYPWSVPPESLSIAPMKASYYADTTAQCVGDFTAGCAVTDYVQVGLREGDGRWGHADLGGNVMEWNLDYSWSPYPQNPCIDCVNLTPVGAGSRVRRGGAYTTGANSLRAAARDELPPSAHIGTSGIRCARAP